MLWLGRGSNGGLCLRRFEGELASGGLAACGGGSSKKTEMMPEPPPPEPTAQERCVMDGGRWNADMTCTTAADLAAEAEAATEAADTKLTAMTTEAGQETGASLGGSAVTATGNAEGAYNLVIAADRTATITVEGATDDDDEDFVQAMDLGGGTTMHTRTMEANADGDMMQEIVIVTPTERRLCRWSLRSSQSPLRTEQSRRLRC